MAAWLGLAGVAADEPLGVDTHEQGGVAPDLCEGTAGAEPAGKAENATAAKSEALVPWAKGEAKREVDAPLQGSPNGGKHHSGREAL